MSRGFVLGVAASMMLAFASNSNGQDREAVGREGQKQDEASRLEQLRAEEAAELRRQKGLLAEIRARKAAAAAVEEREASRTITIKGNFLVNGQVIRLSQAVTLVSPEPSREMEEDADAGPEPVEAAPVRGNRILLSYAVAEENFDTWAFGAGIGADERRSRLAAIVEDKIRETTGRHHLTDGESAKLRLAGTGDIKRLFDAIEASRRGFNAVRGDFVKGARALEGLQALAFQFKSGPFDHDSLFAKTLAKILVDRSAVSTGAGPKD